MDESESLDALANILTSLSKSPFEISLHAEHIRLAESIKSFHPTHLSAAREMFTAHFPAGEEVWMPLIKEKEESLDMKDVESLLDMLELYTRAEGDYLSMPILQKNLDFLIERHTWFASLEDKPEDYGELLSTEWTRSVISSIVSKGAGHLTQSHILWDLQRDWETGLLEAASPSEKQAQIANVEALLLERLQQPHADYEKTYELYSTFTTNHKPAGEYENLLVAASKLRGPAVKAYQRVEVLEQALVEAKFSLEAYAYYIAAVGQGKKPNMFILCGLYERAIAEAARRQFVGEEGAQVALRSFWGGYCNILRQNKIHEKVEGETLKRAIRSVPGAGDVWACYLRFLERTADKEDDQENVPDAFIRAISTNLLQKDVEQLVPVVLTRAGYELRRIQNGAGDEASVETLMKILEDGIISVRQASPTGDPRLRLEKFLTEICFDLNMHEKAKSMWEATAKHLKTSYLVWTSFTDFLIRSKQNERARTIFLSLVFKKLDWPEAIWEAWLAFEHMHGSIQELEVCLDKIEHAQNQLNARRAKEMEEASYQALQLAAEQQTSVAPLQEGPDPTEAGTAMNVDTPVISEAGTKRKAEDTRPIAESSKKARIEQNPPPLKRDRENSTVFVADLPDSATEEELITLFNDCGKVREIKFTQLQGSLVATVEFFERDSVPAALTKDKKRLRGKEIAVHLAWKSTLYVTNFPESTDDAAVRDLFGQYGLIFDVRWPSKKFKSTRRFCYVQYASPSSAERALELHGRQLEVDRSLSVLISNPERKKERTDADADEREVYIAGLSKFTTKEDLEKLFKLYGPVKDVRMASEPNGQSKGFAFVEFEEEKDAQAALGANNYELKKRRIAVTLADSRVRARNRNFSDETVLMQQAEARSRSVRIRNLPSTTQEGTLQQVIEKHAHVKRVEFFQDKSEAIVELESAAEAGKLLLRSEPITYNDKPLELSEVSQSGQSYSRPAAPPSKTGGLFVPRAAASRPRAGLGPPRKPGVGAGTKGVMPTLSSNTRDNTQRSQPQKGRGQDDFRKMLSGNQ